MTAELIWYAVILAALAVYVVLDGYDLGIGVLTFAERDPARRRRMIDLVATMWDGNETWLLVSVVGVWAGFPLVLASALPHLYLGVIAMLVLLAVRGFSFEMQASSPAYDPLWGTLFGIASGLVAFIQGTMAGALLKGVTPIGQLTGSISPLGFLDGFTICSGLAVVALYSLAGSAWLAHKTDGELGVSARRTGQFLVPVTAALLVLAGVLYFTLDQHLASAHHPATVVALVLAVVACLLAAGAFFAFRRPGRDWLPFVCVALATVCGTAAVPLGLYPIVLPDGMTLKEASAPSSTLHFVLGWMFGFLVLFAAYTVWAYRIFRGKFAGYDTEKAIPPGSVAMGGGHLRTVTPPLPWPARIVAVVLVVALWVGALLIAQMTFTAYSTWGNWVAVFALAVVMLAAWVLAGRREPRPDAADPATAPE
ncbi:cytochrome d ubiquinol oxidase subunit II [Streptomyces sp. NPDC093544]|uniref:cytochrome d ubiquinol oxidase subunit II n=1 Tax=Streptomyces sp. NPDC093544 TaxID=3155200 RepID=UPI00343F5EE1